MKKLFTIPVGVALATILFATSTHAAPEKSDSQESDEMKVKYSAVHITKGDLTDLVLESKNTLKEFTTGESPRISQEKLQAAQCVLIFPQVTKAAALVGGKHGDGIATCTDQGSNGWSQVAFVDLRGISFGTQLGVERSAVVMLLNTKKAQDSLKQGKMRFTADVSYVIGQQGNKREVATDRGDVEIYSDRAGAFASASLSGSYVAADDEEMEKFYEEEVNTIFAALSAAPSESSHTVVNDLLLMLPTSKG